MQQSGPQHKNHARHPLEELQARGNVHPRSFVRPESEKYGPVDTTADSDNLVGWWDADGNPNTKLLPYKTNQQSTASYIVAAFDPSIAGNFFSQCPGNSTILTEV